MASELGQPPPAKRPPQAPTTITDIGDDLLREVFLLLPSLPSLVRAALACRTFLHAVRSTRPFRRRFQALHPPQILGFFVDPFYAAFPTFAPLRSRSDDPDLAAAVRGTDFSLTRLPEGGAKPWWEIQSCHGGYVVLVNYAMIPSQMAAYNPLTRALDIFPPPPVVMGNEIEFHILFSEDDQGLLRVLCVQHRYTPAYIGVFSSATREWQSLPWVETDDDGHELDAGTQLNGLVYWKHTSQACVLILDTATLQFSRLNLPPFFREIAYNLFRMGHTKDGKLCLVAADNYHAKIGSLVVWVWRADDDDSVEKWILDDTFPLSKLIAEDDARVNVQAVIDGSVYLSADYDAHARSLLSFCLETAKMNTLFDGASAPAVHPYIMPWPASLVCNKAINVWRLIRRAVASGLRASCFSAHIQKECSDLEKVWKTKVEEKVRFFIWLILQNRQWTADRLLKRGWNHSDKCNLCNQVLEDAAHLTLFCPFSKEVWANFATTDQRVAAIAASANSIQEWWHLNGQGSNQCTAQQTTVSAYILWNIWNERNRRIFQNVELRANAVAQLARQEISRFRAANIFV